MSIAKHILTLEKLSGGYNSKSILKDITLSISKGEAIGIMGGNGIGKTTLANIIAGYSENYGGLIHKMDSDIPYVFQDYESGLLPWFSGLKNIEIITKLNSLSIIEYSKIFEPHNILDKPIYQLSGGNKQTILLISILLSESSFAIMDEPFSALSATNKLIAIKKIREQVNSGRSFIIFLHDVFDMVRVVDKIYFLYGSPASLSNSFHISHENAEISNFYAEAAKIRKHMESLII